MQRLNPGRNSFLGSTIATVSTTAHAGSSGLRAKGLTWKRKPGTGVSLCHLFSTCAEQIPPPLTCVPHFQEGDTGEDFVKTIHGKAFRT